MLVGTSSAHFPYLATREVRSGDNCDLNGNPSIGDKNSQEVATPTAAKLASLAICYGN